MTVQRKLSLPNFRDLVVGTQTRPIIGNVERILGTMIEVRMAGLRIGEVCRIHDPSGVVLDAEVVGLEGVLARLTPLGEPTGLSSDAVVERVGAPLSVAVSGDVLGCVFDGLGRPLDGIPAPRGMAMRLEGCPPSAFNRRRVTQPLATGVRVIDGLLTCAEGQRIGIFGSAGAGKSTLLAQIVAGTQADVIVVGLVGERGREVGDFMASLDRMGAREHTSVVAATSDRPALERVKAAQTATAIAEWFRDQGKSVLLVIDSLTRLARAWREIGLAAGEPPARRGFPPSVFAALPRLLERAGPGENGSITAFYTVLVEGDLASDPVAEDVKAIVDGHIVLSPDLAARDHFPAINVLASRSRLMHHVVSEQQRTAATHIRALLQRLDEIEMLVRVGEYRPGEDKLADEALAKRTAIDDFLCQDSTPVSFAQTVGALEKIAS